MNLNTFIDRLTNFKIKFTEDPSPIEISNKDLIFKTVAGNTHSFINVMLDDHNDRIVITLE